jgi:methyl-accepting chemotaxis protein
MTAGVKTGVEQQRIATGEISGSVQTASKGAAEAKDAIGEARDAASRHAHTAHQIAAVAEDLGELVGDLTGHVDSLGNRLKA